MSDKTRLENNNLELMNIYNAVENLPSAGGDVKLYDSIANMNLDHNVDDGQLAIVYSNTSANITADTEFQIGTFPETVVLPTAIEDYLEVGFRAVDESVMFDCWGQLDASRYSINCQLEDGNIRIQYESQDGITYTRTRFMKNNEEISGDEMDFGLTIKFGSRWGDAQWDDRIGYFTQAGAVAFDGLYQYGNNAYSLAKTQFNTNSDLVYNSIFYGKNGIEEGTLQNVENLSKEQALSRTEIYSSISMLNLADDVTDLIRLFSNHNDLIVVPNMNTSKITSMYESFSQCHNLISIPDFNTSSVINMSGMFMYCNNLMSVPNFDTSKVINMRSIFMGCTNLITVSDLDMSNASDASFIFHSCTNLISVGTWNFSNAKTMFAMFYECRNLVSIPNFNTNSTITMTSMFYNCQNLSSASYANIANSLPLAVNLTNQYVSDMGLNIENFTLEQKQILGNKGYYEALPYVLNTSNMSTSWNILYS